MAKINEGMRAGDLADLVLPMISVDEYESKIDDSSIVIGFYIHDQDAASDLNRFLQKSPIQIIDTEISPAPDQHGYYIVFVELINDRRIAKNIADILAEVSPLTTTEKWQMRLRGHKEVMPFSQKELDKYFSKLREDNVDDIEEQIMEFLKRSSLEDVIFESDSIYLKSSDGSFRADVVEIGCANTILENNKLINEAVSLKISDIAFILRIQRILGEGWIPSRIGANCILQRSDSDTALLVKDIKFI